MSISLRCECRRSPRRRSASSGERLGLRIGLARSATHPSGLWPPAWLRRCGMRRIDGHWARGRSPADRRFHITPARTHCPERSGTDLSGTDLAFARRRRRRADAERQREYQDGTTRRDPMLERFAALGIGFMSLRLPVRLLAAAFRRSLRRRPRHSHCPGQCLAVGKRHRQVLAAGRPILERVDHRRHAHTGVSVLGCQPSRARPPGEPSRSAIAPADRRSWHINRIQLCG